MNKKNRQVNRQTGFTLLEVLVALAIVAVALAAAIKSTSSMTHSAFYLRQKVLAHWVAMNRMTELQLEHAWPSTGTQKDEVEMAGIEWEWEQKTVETPEKAIRRVEIGVRPLDSEAEEGVYTTLLVGFLPNPELINLNPVVNPVNPNPNDPSKNPENPDPSRNPEDTPPPPPPPPPSHDDPHPNANDVRR